MWSDLLNNHSLIFWGAITLMAIVPSLAYYWWKVRRAEIEASLKRDMLDRGMPAEDIERVLKAQGPK